MGQIKAKTQIEKMGFKDSDKKNPKHDQIQIWAYNNADTILKETILKNKDYKLIYRKWERDLIQTSSTDFKQIIGFVDLDFCYEAEFYFEENGGFTEKERRHLIIEIKTAIPNLGELIRQMNTYRRFSDWGGTKYMVISPDDRYAEIIREQGILFYKYKDPNLLF